MRCTIAFACALAVSVTVSLLPVRTNAEALTAEAVVRLAAASAPQVLIAETGVLGARGRVDDARALGQDNPIVTGLHGSGETPDDASEIELEIPLGFGLKRTRRIAEAQAGLERETHMVADVQRRAVGWALAAFYRVLHAEERRSISRDRRYLAEEVRRVASEKVRTGDAPRLELIVAEGELSRAESEVLAEDRGVTQARVELATMLGLPSGANLEIAGDLSDRSLFDAIDISSDPARRPDVLAAESEMKASLAAVSGAQAAVLPGFSFVLSYQHSRSDDIVRPGLSVSLPLFNRGRGIRGEARARQERAAVELAAQRSAALAESEGAWSAYRSAIASAREIEEHGLARALEMESLARESYEAGKLDLPGLLIVRSSALDTRREHADRMLDAALAGIDLGVAVGALPSTP